MGDYSFGCAITGVAIGENDEVLHVVVYNENYLSAYGLWDRLSAYRHEARGGLFRQFNDESLTGRQLEEIHKQALQDLRQFVVAHYSVYDGYGWVRTGRLSRKNAGHFMVARSVSDRIALECGIDTVNPNDVLWAVAQLAFLCRINLFGVGIGPQHFDENEAVSHRFRLDLIQARLKEMGY